MSAPVVQVSVSEAKYGVPFSEAPTLVEPSTPTKSAKTSNILRVFLLLLFCLAQFLDVFNISALFSSLPVITSELNMTSGQAIWVISAYQLTFAAFLLLSGRLSDVYNPKYSFVGGTAFLGVLSLGAGFTRQKIGLIVLRGISGLAGALTIPASLNLIVHLFPEEKEQARAIGVFGSSGAAGNMLGLIIGALLVQYASWPWVFWFATIIILLISALCIFLIPTKMAEPEPVTKNGEIVAVQKAKGLDVIGVAILTAALILLIFGVTSGTTSGWGTAIVLAPLFISVALFALFFWYETRIPEENAALPPSVWFYPNFAVLFAVALFPYLWWTAGFYLFTSYWQDIVGWQPIISAIHFLPIGMVALPAMPFAGNISRYFGLKRTILFGLILTLISTGLQTLGSNKSHYWPIIFPAFIIGTFGTTLAYANTSIAMFHNTPARMAGTVGAIFNSALQVGAAIGISAVTSIESSVEARTPGGAASFKGREAGFWFTFAIVGVELLAVLIFFRDEKKHDAGHQSVDASITSSLDISKASSLDLEKNSISLSTTPTLSA
ncbi:MFS general substrate transporter [Sistotremastrum suecicum HHB10207 ss-3]|uniref:MFS general substrate transporter n=1 Tax=Sistotremastrum suecicum HHB10207 ss-3 TaxID=1314776 RepID=A0A165ZVV4_9AGAM|nr:MFS general substrate transporter [Sistotremastrum suecicum HHB10207 ss-3]